MPLEGTEVEFQQRFKLLARFHEFGRGLDAEGEAQLLYGCQNILAIFIARDIPDKFPVYLQLRKRQAFKVR